MGNAVDARLAYILKTPCVSLIGDDGEPNGFVVTMPVRLQWPTVNEPKAQSKKPGAKLKYSVVCIAHPETPDAMFDPIRAIVKRVGEKIHGPQFDAKGVDLWARKDVTTPLENQSRKANFDGFTEKGLFFRAAANPEYPPALLDLKGPLPRDTKAIYPGCWAIVKIGAWGMKGENCFVALNLLSIRKLGEDTELAAGGVDAAAGMDGYAAMAGAGGMDASATGM